VRRASIATDIGVAIAIAVVVLGLFIGTKILFFSDGGAGKTASGPIRHGAVAIVINDGSNAEAWVDDKKVGQVSGDSPLTVDKLAPGPHSIRVERKGSSPCLRKVDLSAARVEVVTCRFAEPAVGGVIQLEGVREGERVFVDEQEISQEAAVSPIALTAGFHRIRVRNGEDIVDEIDVSVKAGEEQIAKVERENETPVDAEEEVASAGGSRDSGGGRGTGHRASGGGGGASGGGEARAEPNEEGDDAIAPDAPDGFLIAYTQPFARVFVDGADTGKMTPIAPSAKIALSPGKHQVMFSVSGEKYSYSVRIKSGETLNLVRDLE